MIRMCRSIGATAVLALLIDATTAASSVAVTCSSTLSASYAAPSVADGYVARLVATGLNKPRGILFDNDDQLLIVESGVGISALTINDDADEAGCLSASVKKRVLTDSTLNHGIQLSLDGKTLYASSASTAYSWAYDSKDQTNTSEPTTLVENMSGTDHTTRTLLLPKHAPGLLVVCRGSTSNIDTQALDIDTGHSQIKAYNITNATGPYDYTRDGLLLGWGLRNEVGIAEEPITGGIYGVENSVDEMTRQGKDIHQNNPGEELNFLGYLNGTESSNQGRNFGYPSCFSAWNVTDIPDFSGKVGEQFAIGNLNSTVNDTTCSEANRQAPRLVFQAHMAPLDILFNPAGTAAWVSFHGSWNRDEPVGYKVSVISFANGEPVEPSDSQTAAIDILANEDNSKCPDHCFRPVCLAFDSKGRLFMSSDATGEIYAILRADGMPTSGVGSNATGTIPASNGTGTTTSPSASTSSSVAGGVHVTKDIAGMSALAFLFAAVAFVV
ncbi:Hypothetical protein R9X50_00251100 [Acrodontium crateriforme]|uniref:Pyrroloquinoline quinone-dependent pyranose dehydrogenase beta-propeller domain-containing protein n=1 Tax=Acrodontium crateriforme TaxID=150365 RepID=A0AAQ3M401_9PEZI|nr:Hypothetical protein R9X50_00251100 [Acrodontium crateriforme]